MPLTGTPDEVCREAFQIIRHRIYSFDVGKFYIGRTYNLAGRQRGHGCDAIIPMYQTESIQNARQVESRLIRSLKKEPKFFRAPMRNAANDSRGRTAKGIQFVYLAIWRARLF